MIKVNLLAGNVGNHHGQLVDRHHFFRADIYRAGKVGTGQAQRAFNAFIHIEERTRLQAIAPDLDRVAGLRLGDLAAERGRGLFLAAIPGALRAEDVVITGNARFHPAAAGIGQVQAFGEQFLPAIFAVRCGRIGAVFTAVRIVRVFLVIGRVHTGRGGIEDALAVTLVGRIEDVEVDRGGVVHHVGIIVAGEDIACAAHVGSQLVDLVKLAVDHFTHEQLVAQITHHEIVCLGVREFVHLEVNAAHPIAFALEAADKVPPDESACAADQNRFHDKLHS